MCKPVRLLFIISNLGRGGTERNLVYLASALDRNRFDVRIWCLEDGGDQIRILKERNIPVTILDIPKVNSPAAILRLFGLGRRLRRERTDCICCFSFDAELLGIPLGWIAGVPVRTSVRRDLGDWGRTRRQYRYRRWLNRLTDCVIANCRTVAATAIRREKLSPEKMKVIPNGVPAPPAPDTVRVRAWKDRLSPDGLPVVVMVGNYRNRVKGHDVFIKAAYRMRQESVACWMVIAGTGMPGTAYDNELKHMAADAAAGGTVIFTGPVTDVPGLLAVADICVNPSLSEGMSNAVLEYMAAGKPVVATAVGGTPEVVEEGETGLLVPPGDPDALAAAIGRLLKNTTLRTAMGLAGAKRAAETFSVENMKNAYTALFEDLVHGRIRDDG